MENPQKSGKRCAAEGRLDDQKWAKKGKWTLKPSNGGSKPPYIQYTVYCIYILYIIYYLIYLYPEPSLIHPSYIATKDFEVQLMIPVKYKVQPDCQWLTTHTLFLFLAVPGSPSKGFIRSGVAGSVELLTVNIIQWRSARAPANWPQFESCSYLKHQL